MTATTETAVETQDSTTETAETPAVKYPTYRELAVATWKLAHRLSERGRGSFCDSGTNDYLRYFGLPDLNETTGSLSDEQVESYLDAYLAYKNWSPNGATPEDDAEKRRDLSRRIRAQLQRNNPDTRVVMNRWLDELGLEHLEVPREFGSAFRVGARRANGVPLSRQEVQEALRQALPDLDIEVVRY